MSRRARRLGGGQWWGGKGGGEEGRGMEDGRGVGGKAAHRSVKDSEGGPEETMSESESSESVMDCFLLADCNP